MERYFQIRKVRVWIFLKVTFPNTLSVFNTIQVCSLKVLDLVGDHSVCRRVVDSDMCSQ